MEPLITVVGLLYFLATLIVYKYQMLYVFAPKYQNGGKVSSLSSGPVVPCWIRANPSMNVALESEGQRLLDSQSRCSEMHVSKKWRLLLLMFAHMIHCPSPPPPPPPLHCSLLLSHVHVPKCATAQQKQSADQLLAFFLLQHTLALPSDLGSVWAQHIFPVVIIASSHLSSSCSADYPTPDPRCCRCGGKWQSKCYWRSSCSS